MALPASEKNDSYLVSIHNRSGVTSSYAIIVAPPTVYPLIDPKDFSIPIFCTFKNVPSGKGAAVFTIPKQIHAVCGTAIHDSTPLLEVFDQAPVTCAQRLQDGRIKPGTSLRLHMEHSQPAFSYDGNHSDKPNAFSIVTQSDFLLADAKQNGLFIGVCGPWRGVSFHRKIGFYSTFTPKPNAVHYIQPRPIIGILLGDFQPRAKFIGLIEDILEVNFDQLGSDDVEIVHTDRNQLVIFKAPALYNEVTL